MTVMMKMKWKRRITGLAAAAVLFLSSGFAAAKADTVFEYYSPELILNSEDNTQEMEERERMIGRLYVPSLNINVAMFDITNLVTNATEESAAEAEGYLDGTDNGIAVNNDGVWELNDHASEYGYEGSSKYKNIQYAVVGETQCYFQVGTTVYSFVCVATGKAINTGTDFIDEETGLCIHHEIDYGVENYFVSCTCRDSSGVGVYYVVYAYTGTI